MSPSTSIAGAGGAPTSASSVEAGGSSVVGASAVGAANAGGAPARAGGLEVVLPSSPAFDPVIPADPDCHLTSSLRRAILQVRIICERVSRLGRATGPQRTQAE